MNGKLIAACVLAAFLMGSCVGANSVTPEVDFVEVERIKVIKESAPPPEEVAVIPEACQDAIKLAYRLTNSAENLYAKGETQLKIISDGRLFMADGRDTDSIEDRQRNLQGNTVGILLQLEEDFVLFDKVDQDCKEMMK